MYVFKVFEVKHERDNQLYTLCGGSWFNGLSFQQGDNPPERRSQWQRPPDQTRTENRYFVYKQQTPVSSPSSAKNKIKSNKALTIGVSASTPHTITEHGAAVIKVLFSALDTPWPFPVQTLIVSVKPRLHPLGRKWIFYVGETDEIDPDNGSQWENVLKPLQNAEAWWCLHININGFHL